VGLITVQREHRFVTKGQDIVVTDCSQKGLTHGFVVEFASKEDRDYYVSTDPSHKAFQKKNRPRFDDVRVIDYEKGVY